MRTMVMMKLTQICSVYQRPQIHPKCNWAPWARSQDLQPQTPHNTPHLHSLNTLLDKPSPSLSADNTSLLHQISVDTSQENNPIFHFNQNNIRKYHKTNQKQEKRHSEIERDSYLGQDLIPSSDSLDSEGFFSTKILWLESAAMVNVFERKRMLKMMITLVQQGF